MGMDSEKLSAREKQPGHDQTFRVSEGNFIEVARRALDPDVYVVSDRPQALLQIFETDGDARNLGVRPEASITHRSTGRKLFVEVKKQGDRGNAEERAMKHHTVQFYKTLKDAFGYGYHPFVTIFCESLATNPRYTAKFKYLIEPDHYFLWVGYDETALADYLRSRCSEWLA